MRREEYLRGRYSLRTRFCANVVVWSLVLLVLLFGVDLIVVAATGHPIPNPVGNINALALMGLALTPVVAMAVGGVDEVERYFRSRFGR